MDYCLYGAPWRKRTGLWSFLVDLDAVCCTCSSKKGICDRTGQPHVWLEGTLHGANWTLLAEAYPKPLCIKIAKAFSRSIDELEVMCVNTVLAASRTPKGCSGVFGNSGRFKRPQLA